MTRGFMWTHFITAEFGSLLLHHTPIAAKLLESGGTTDDLTDDHIDTATMQVLTSFPQPCQRRVLPPRLVSGNPVLVGKSSVARRPSYNS